MCVSTTTIKDETLLCCFPCSQGQRPGEGVRKNAILLYNENNRGKELTVIDSSKQTIPIPLVQEYSYFSKFKKNTPPPTAGCFALTNKSEKFISVKLFYRGDCYNEATRPIFFPVAPLETIYGSFAESVSELNMIVLVDNPHAIPTSNKVYLETNAKQQVTPCARVEYFENFLVYAIPCRHRNVVLRYKPDKGIYIHEDKITGKTAVVFSKMMSSSMKVLNDSISLMSSSPSQLAQGPSSPAGATPFENDFLRSIEPNSLVTSVKLVHATRPFEDPDFFTGMVDKTVTVMTTMPTMADIKSMNKLMPKLGGGGGGGGGTSSATGTPDSKATK